MLRFYREENSIQLNEVPEVSKLCDIINSASKKWWSSLDSSRQKVYEKSVHKSRQRWWDSPAGLERKAEMRILWSDPNYNPMAQQTPQGDRRRAGSSARMSERMFDHRLNPKTSKPLKDYGSENANYKANLARERNRRRDLRNQAKRLIAKGQEVTFQVPELRKSGGIAKSGLSKEQLEHAANQTRKSALRKRAAELEKKGVPVDFEVPEVQIGGSKIKTGGTEAQQKARKYNREYNRG